jgi:hypothetical protein
MRSPSTTAATRTDRRSDLLDCRFGLHDPISDRQLPRSKEPNRGLLNPKERMMEMENRLCKRSARGCDCLAGAELCQGAQSLDAGRLAAPFK